MIHGNSLPEGADPVEGKRVTLDVGGALPVEATDGEDIVGIPRHGFDRSIPAHLVDHRRNIRAACELGCDRVLALASVGSLDKDLKVGMLICPEDFYAPETAPSFYRDPRGHSVPGFDPDWRDVVISAWGSLTDDRARGRRRLRPDHRPALRDAGRGARARRGADMVGMTIAAEAILAGEAALAYAAVCTVDNLANGISDKPLTVDEYRRGRDLTAKTLAADLEFVLPALAKGLPGS